MGSKKESIKITSRSHAELSSKLVIGGEEYLVQTEGGTKKSPSVITRIYYKGEILSTRKTGYEDILKLPDLENMVRDIMERQHQFAINMFRSEKMKVAKTPSGYLNDVKVLLADKKNENALELLQEAVDQYPDDPFILSYYGCLDAIVSGNYREGISLCNRAFGLLKGRLPFGEDLFYPVLYLNLGRAYLAAGRKKNAINAFKKGLDIDSGNSDLIKELGRLGIRSGPAVSFLSRSNPINKYIGKLLYKIKN